MKAIAGGGEIPILHVLYDNATAIALYENVGFVTRRTFHLTVMQRADVLG
jgi:predicted GNAT family acetyltransferase